jgi:DNA modification methylase
MNPIVLDDGRITLYCGNCETLLDKIPKDAAIVADPPYGIHTCENRRGFMADRIGQEAAAWDAPPPPKTLRAIMASVSDVIIWGYNYFADTLGRCVSPLLWDKKTGDNYFADGELAWTSFKTGTLRIFRHQWCGAFKDSERGVSPIHPTQKPVALMEWCMRLIDNAGTIGSGLATIFDPYGGVFTTAVAAIRQGRKIISCEIDAGYYQKGLARVKEELRQRDGRGPIFDGNLLEKA